MFTVIIYLFNSYRMKIFVAIPSCSLHFLLPSYFFFLNQYLTRYHLFFSILVTLYIVILKYFFKCYVVRIEDGFQHQYITESGLVLV